MSNDDIVILAGAGASNSSGEGSYDQNVGIMTKHENFVINTKSIAARHLTRCHILMWTVAEPLK